MEKEKKSGRYPWKDSNVVWHPYPQEKPENDDMYIVTTKLKTGVCSVIPAWYSEAFGWNDDDVCCNQVIAWTTFPEPYKEEV